MRIAVIGSGISGNAAAWALSRRHDVTLYERRKRPGGHSVTVDVDCDGEPIAVDTGFIVFNENNYPTLTRLFNQLGVAGERSDMSFSVSLDSGRFEWCGRTWLSLFAQRRNLFSPGFLMMLGDIVRFNSLAKRDLESGALCGMSFGDYMDRRGFSSRLRDAYIVPLTAAIWSTPAARMLDFPAESLVRFLDNHRLIHLRRPAWRTVRGGSRNYVRKLLGDYRGRLLLDREVVAVSRDHAGVTIRDRSGNAARYDAVVFACHSDETLRLLSDPTQEEREILGAVQFKTNVAWLHRDPALMPKRKAAWASWNYIGSSRQLGDRNLSVTYWMNLLQNIDRRHPLFVTLNPPQPPRDELVVRTFRFGHPQFDAAALAAQLRLPSIQGVRNTWFCGAWTRYGFHEDGLVSGLEVATRLGSPPLWIGEAGGRAQVGRARLEATGTLP
jgi:predicted NAD/FAD-binding protein